MLAPHTIMCMAVESFTEENRGSATCGPYISLVDVTCVKSLQSSYMGKYSQNHNTVAAVDVAASRRSCEPATAPPIQPA